MLLFASLLNGFGLRQRERERDVKSPNYCLRVEQILHGTEKLPVNVRPD